MIIKNIGELVGIVPEGVLRKQGAEMAETGVLKDAWIAIEDGKIAGFGKMADLVGHDAPSVIPGSDRESLDAEGGMVTAIRTSSMPAAATGSSWTRSTVFPTRKSRHAAAASSTPPTCCTKRPRTNSTASRWSASAR